MRLSKELSLVKKGLKSFEELKKDFIFEEYDYNENLIDELDVCRNESIFQGILVYAVGTAKDLKKVENKLEKISFNIHTHRMNKYFNEKDNRGTFRAKALSLVTIGKENYKIKIALVFSHNKYLRGYLYDIPYDNLFILCPQLTRKFIKQNKKIKHIDEIENMQTIFINKFDDFDETILNKINKEKANKKGTVILFKDTKTYYEFSIKLSKIMPRNSHVFIESLN